MDRFADLYMAAREPVNIPALLVLAALFPTWLAGIMAGKYLRGIPLMEGSTSNRSRTSNGKRASVNPSPVEHGSAASATSNFRIFGLDGGTSSLGILAPDSLPIWSCNTTALGTYQPLDDHDPKYNSSSSWLEAGYVHCVMFLFLVAVFSQLIPILKKQRKETLQSDARFTDPVYQEILPSMLIYTRKK